MFKLSCPATEVKAVGSTADRDSLRAAETFIGECPTVDLSVGGVELQALLDTGSQVTLMHQSLFSQHFDQYTPF